MVLVDRTNLLETRRASGCVSRRGSCAPGHLKLAGRAGQASSPLDKLPSEIIVMILEHASSDEPLRAQDRALVLTHVCRQWMSLLCNTSRLWSTIVFTGAVTGAQVELALVALARSRRQPLDVFVDLRDPLWDGDECSQPFASEHMLAIQAVLLPHVGRWRSMQVLTDTWAPIAFFLSCVQDKTAPVLESIELGVSASEHLVVEDQPFFPNAPDRRPLFTGGLPALRSISLSGVPVHWDSLPSRCTRLRALTINYMPEGAAPSLPQLVAILSSCASSLESLSIVGGGPSSVDVVQFLSNGGADGVRLPRLVRLALGFLDSIQCLGLLSILSAPALEQLVLNDVTMSFETDCDSEVDTQDSTAVFDYLFQRDAEASAPVPLARLRALDLQFVSVAPAALLRVLGRCRTLERFTMLACGEEAVDAFEDAIAGSVAGNGDEKEVFCPNLVNLDISSRAWSIKNAQEDDDDGEDPLAAYE